MNKYAVGNNIDRLLRDRKPRIRQKELAAQIGVTEQTMSNWITGVRPVTAYGLLRISRFLGVTMEQLMEGIDDGK